MTTVLCPRCKSDNIHAGKRGWNLMTGFIGSRKIIITCLNCDNKFKPGEGYGQSPRRYPIHIGWFVLFVVVMAFVILLLQHC